MAVRIAGCTPVLVPTDEQYQLRPDAIRAAITPRTRAVVTISPNNPTGAVYPERRCGKLTRLCRDRGVYHVHDEAYEYFTYGGARHFSPGSIAGSERHTICLFSLSKAYGFASWRIGAHGDPGAPVRRGAEDPGHDPDLPAGRDAVRGGRGDGRRAARTATGHRRAIERRAAGWLRRAAARRWATWCRCPPADGAFYFLVSVDTKTPGDGSRRGAGPRASASR